MSRAVTIRLRGRSVVATGLIRFTNFILGTVNLIATLFGMAIIDKIGFAMMPGLAPGQSTAGLFRITGGVTRNQMNSH